MIAVRWAVGVSDGHASGDEAMPLYEYSCEKCGRKIELLVRGRETPKCPHCQSTRLTKLLSVVSGHVAGGGGDVGAAPGCGRPQCGMGGCAGLG
jgi:putative FmdB family regulatory protein